MVKVIFEKRFKEFFSRIKDKSLKEKIIKQIEKIKANPEIGKPMMYARKGTRELYVKPFRLSYEFFPSEDVVYILELFHKKGQ